ncbi:cytoplasmic dynein 1 heavy chain 1-like [Sinocyclocheilus rhinocerous]|uniref:cytoplasmic dynein 1 heavy chain 1-like n=1 Tax=Sinocyclocheilus rhinocerous TaxID=307959 RepID=UPI0007B9C08C|nr:PREDICTED: cytoplasmic dynein 1 heavy chain 1-like [Sinocyclocheilus rhinocerous]
MSDSGGGEDGGGGMEVSAAVQTVADASVLQKHFRKLVPLLLEDGGDAPASLETALEEKSALEQMRKFLSDPQIHSILVERSALKEDVGDEGEEERECISYSISIDIHYGLKSNSLALIKRTGVIDADKPISTQVRVLTLSEDSPYETLHSFISNAVSPYFKSYIRESGKADRDGDKMAPSVEKKIAELEMGLLHLQQNIEIPEISLLIHPIITNVAKQCYERAEKPKVTDFGDKVEDPSFLNQLQSGVNRWIREIQKVTKLDRDPASGTALQEISFWLNLERALNRIQEKRESPEVLLTLDILKHGKRFHATVSFDTDTGLKQAVETVNDYNPLMKDFPPRWGIFVDEKLQVLLRDIVKRKREENLKMVWRLSPAHRKLQARLDHMRRFRRQHEQLRAVIVRVLRPQVSAVSQHAQGKTAEPDDMKVAEVLFDAADVNAIEEVNLAYENVKEVDGLDVSKEGVEAWEAAMKRYDERIDRVETRITARLRDQLGTAKNANEMFRIFSRFNALFVRPHIRGAIREYQTQLIQRVKDDIEALHDKFKVQYPQSQSCKMSHVRDLPPVSGSIIWAKQIDRQLTAYMKRVEDVLGKGWENHVEGLKLKQDGDSFRAKLNTQEIFDDWAKKVQQRNLGVSGRIFTIENTRARGRTGTVLKLKVNFLPEIITLSKEVRNLKWLSFRVPLAIVNKAHQANQLYPFAISLIESVRTYERTCEKVEERMSISLLVAGLKKEVQALVTEGISLVWESYKLDPYVQRLAETVFNFQEKVDQLKTSYDRSKSMATSSSLVGVHYELSEEEKFYRNALTRMPDGPSALEEAYNAVKEIVSEVEQYVKVASSLRVALEELQDLKGVWSELSKVWEQIDQMKEQPWVSVQPRKLRQSLDALLNQLKNFPARLRQYASYEYVQRLLKGYMKVNMLVIELKSEALKDRHWKQLMKRLHVNWVLSELSLGQIWDVDLQKNEMVVKDVLLVAQGEMALEEFLKQIREVWNSYELDLVNYQNKCRLIRGWDDLFNKVKEHINSVSAMKLSPYYKVFEEDALSWEDKLNRIMALFDVWIDVQRRWVYLEGIFTGSADIKHLLPVETQRFQSISTEFLALMKKVTKSPLVMDVLNIQGVQRSLERLADLLGKIQKALGEYLERERSSFPRFYFVGDEDLLEIIGNSKNVAKLQKHFKKMFAGVSSILLNEDNTEVLGISSREGEEVLYKTPVSITEHPKINEWLTLVEREMRVTLAKLLAESVTEVGAFNKSTGIDLSTYINWIDRYQAQLVVLSTQIDWSENVESALTTIGGGEDMGPLQAVLANVKATLNLLADTVLMEQPPLRRKKLEHLITELVHQRDVTRTLIKNKIDNPKSFEWLSQMRFYFDPKQTDVLQQLSIQMANAKFNYGFEYLGVQEKLVQTPLTDRCYLTMTQALEARLGGSPFGPAGTGKTESVKALGHQLGRFVLVFNCDETFDFQAMGRIFVGLCQVGAWGCFDEFNRLEERMLSAVSQQVQYIQVALREHSNPNRDHSVPVTTELLNKQVKVSAEMAIFITMNPGYAGRSNLPDNLKKLFRSLAMTKPDRQLIAQVMLYSQGFRTAEILAKKIVPFFKLCDEQLSSQSHYDFGLRALKSVLISAGNVKRERIQKIKREKRERGEDVDENEIAENLPEQEILIQSVCETMVPKLVAEDIPLLFSLLSDVFPGILIQSVCETMVPKLVAEDIPLLFSLLSDVFPGVQYMRGEMTALREELRKVCAEMYLTYGDGDDVGSMWVEKIQRDAAAVLQPYFTSTGLVIKALEHASKMEHIMDFTRLRSLSSLFSMLHQACRNVALYNNNHHDFPMPIDQLEKYMQKYLIYAVLWSFSGDSRLKMRAELGEYIRRITTVSLPSAPNHVVQKYLIYAVLWSFSGDSRLKMRAELGEYIRRITTVSLPSAPNVPIIDYEVSITGEWQSWQVKVPQIEVETHKVASPDVVVPTLDTVRHEALLYTWLAEHKPLVLCGPPGSGKTMTLFSALRALPDMEVVGLNFSSATTPELLLKTFDHYCEYRRTPNGVVLAPVQLGKWLVLFCDEINLPDMDKYGTQRVISFIRQMVEHGGFYRTSDQTWVKLERIQFVGACNPPTDPGRKPLSYRFLRHVPVVYVDYPGPASLTQIYGTFNRAMLRLIPSLRTFAEPLTAAMVEFYTMSQERFTQDTQPHYIYSPREMTRWVRGIFEALRPLETLPVEGLIRIWAHEALRLFQDRVLIAGTCFSMWQMCDCVVDGCHVFALAGLMVFLLRCVLNWFGDWSTEALYQVGKEFTSKMDLEKPNYKVPDYMPTVYDKLPQPPTHREAIVNGCVFVHQTLHQANNRLAKRGGRTMAITPRHYLDFINHYANLFNEKRSELEEQQMHLNVGLRKIKETVDQVEELRRDLRIKSQELEVKNAAANDKLKKMVKDQQEAEKKKVMSQDIQEAVYKQQEVIKVKQLSVKQDLDQVEPAVIEAQNAVKSIKKQHLVEVRSMANPPAAVKLALESICLLLGESTTDWKQIRSIIMRENFIPTIVNFSADEISDSIREKMKKNYMSNPSYNYEQVNRASLACGPMVKWAIAQLNYADMLKRVEPLRNELQKLEDDAKDNKTKAEEVEQMIRDLENSIARYKEEYAVLISEAQAIKADLAAVEAKVNRSTALLKSLSAERERWEKTSETFKNQMSTIAGDCLVSAAFIAYAGYFDQQMRQNLFTTWSHHLQQANIQFRTDIARTEYLSNADERLRWQANSLPADDLCTENAIMLKRFNRYPLIIDPSGQATEFIMNEYKDKKITRTSFLDDAFRKNLESALRFGNPLLVQDVESYDPILNPVLNREVRRTGGRVLITLGDQDIDLSPSFVIFLSTRDPTVEFPPDLCSRVTFVNFTVTRSSLQSQCLNEVLKAERPDVDEKRSDLLKLQGEFQLRLRQLEKSLLQALNEVKGRILDDDTIITTLENLKKEAAEVTRKVEETDIIMQEVETVSQQYLSLSSACSSIYFTMEALNQMHFLYQYSLQFFLDIYHTVLYENSNLKSVSDHTQRLSHITKDLFQVAFNRVARGMLHQDHVTFAMLLSRINLKGMTSEPSFDAEFQHFLRGKEIVLSGTTVPKVKGLSSEQSEAMVRLSRLPAFKDLVSKVQADEQFFMWIESNSPELSVPYLWTEEKTSTLIGQAVHQLLLIQAFRPDRLLAMTHILVSKVMGENFMAIMEQPLDLANIVDSEVKPGTPVLMCSVPGYDASGLVRDLAAEQNKHITSISIGSAEGFNKADRDINTAVKSGRWVMLENVHLAPGWLMQLEKKLHSMQPHACFRLFLTMEINPKVPVNLLRAGRIFVFEPPPGMKANMLRTFSSIPVARMCKSPNERARLYFLLAWFHAVIQERLRYAPLGWSKKYEFGESDLRSACDTVDTWLDDTAKGRQNISPDKIPWAALRTLMAQSIYGGRIDNEFDQRLLNTFLERLFTTSSFDSEFKLALKVDGHKDIKMPDGIRREEFIHWVEMLPDTQTPSWLGLPSNAEKVLLTTQGIDMMGKLLKMQMLEDEDDLAYETEKKQRSTSSSDTQPAWMRTLHTTARNWLQLIPESVSPLKRTVENIKDPLFRFFEREVKMGSRMLQDVRQDLTDVVHVCEGKKKQTNDLRTLINDLVKGILPRSWSRYTVPAAMTVIQWVADFSERIKQLQQISQGAASGGAKELKNIHVNLGGLFVPEAYITATRQYVAQVNSWSLEELCLEVNVTSAQGAALDACSFGIRGLKLQGATCANNKLSLSTSISTELPLTQLHWMKQSNTEKRSMVTLPVYLNFTRSDLIFTVDFDIATKEDPHHFYERGVAILCTD